MAAGKTDMGPRDEVIAPHFPVLLTNRIILRTKSSPGLSVSFAAGEKSQTGKPVAVAIALGEKAHEKPQLQPAHLVG